MKFGFRIIVFAVVVSFIATESFAQCFGGRCCGRSISRFSTGYSYASTGYGFADAQPCLPCQNVLTAPCNACASVESVEESLAVETENVGACNACETVESTEPVAACAAVKTTSTVNDCVGGFCPVRTATKTAVKTAQGVVATARNVVVDALSVVNQARIRAGVAPLAFDATLTNGAIGHSQSMSRFGALYHARGTFAENCVACSADANEAVNMWLNSPGHAANMLNPSYTRAGIGRATDANGKTYWTLRLWR